jgi:uncharacterized protein YpuA (DUF1002 family)
MKMIRIIFLISVCLSVASPLIAKAAAPITQEEIEAILERNQVDEVSSTSLPADLKRRLGQTVASTTEAIKPAITDTVNKAEQAMATATNKISSTSDKIKNNLENYKTQAKADLSNTILGNFVEILSSIWKAISGWFMGLFQTKS